jgi:hypothetical protein
MPSAWCSLVLSWLLYVLLQVAGPDAKLDKAEFTALITTLLNKSHQAPAPA